jgi:hypothetical protein
MAHGGMPLPSSVCVLTLVWSSMQGFQMAAALHADAVGRGTVPPLTPHAAPPPPYCLAAAAIAADGVAGAAQPAASPVAPVAQQVLSGICFRCIERALDFGPLIWAATGRSLSRLANGVWCICNGLLAVMGAGLLANL